ncbi:FAD-dependent oxidoreductase [Alkalicoccobacillus porphyridii]|uniref:FAD-dependent oxidoreductase n=1 Tax=Alkalicoccobacillus porphyridii TaxID=2597270 RepID=A0A554A188_9BACI|nr:FAD-dependent oxidoreductase [Alkalicoccobacillus porphyridii]TSB47457.1 FAD-dependent oxidoreductase [Alkalicoccobacillus porphyridii]
MKRIKEIERQIPVRIEADVVVCGGGPAGIGAALSSARNGARTVLIESHGFLGGMGTAGMVTSFAYGYHDKERFITGGIFQEIRQKLHERGGLIMTDRKGWEPFNAEQYKILAFELLEEANVELLCHTSIVDAITMNGTIQAIVIESKAGREAIVAKHFIDATGDGDLAERAGAECKIGREKDGGTQPSSLMYVLGNVETEKLGKMLDDQNRRGHWKTDQGHFYLNATGFADEIAQAKQDGYLTKVNRDHVAAIFTVPWMEKVVGVNFGRVQGKSALDPKELTEAEVIGREQVLDGIAFLKEYVPGFTHAELLQTAPQIGIRETRRVIGDYVITQEDIVELKQFDDCIAQSCYMIDIHSPDSNTTEIYKLPKGTHYDIPYRSLLPKGLHNLLVAGRCISATHEALGSFRVQAICLALGEAAGAAAAIANKQECNPRDIDVRELQGILEGQGAILV